MLLSYCPLPCRKDRFTSFMKVLVVEYLSILSDLAGAAAGLRSLQSWHTDCRKQAY